MGGKGGYESGNGLIDGFGVKHHRKRKGTTTSKMAARPAAESFDVKKEGALNRKGGLR